jgi:prophage regulatory protein
MANKILRFSDVQKRIGYSRSTIYNRINPRGPLYDPTFPKPVPLGPRLVGFSESQINDWIEKTLNQ